jgi:hypothetical protein
MPMLWLSNALGCHSAELLEPIGMLLLQRGSSLEKQRKFLWAQSVAGR